MITTVWALQVKRAKRWQQRRRPLVRDRGKGTRTASLTELGSTASAASNCLLGPLGALGIRAAFPSGSLGGLLLPDVSSFRDKVSAPPWKVSRTEGPPSPDPDQAVAESKAESKAEPKKVEAPKSVPVPVGLRPMQEQPTRVASLQAPPWRMPDSLKGAPERPPRAAAAAAGMVPSPSDLLRRGEELLRQTAQPGDQLAGKGFGMLFYHSHICLPNWVIYAALVLFPFAATARHMGSWQSLVWINVATLMGTVLIPLGYYVINGTQEIKVPGSEVEMFSELSPNMILSGLSTFTFGMTSQFMLILLLLLILFLSPHDDTDLNTALKDKRKEIIAEMKEPSDMPKAYAGYSAPFQLVMFSVAGIGGYLYMGNKVNGMMTLDRAPMCGWVSVIGLMLCVAWFLANVVPFFGAAVDLLGASFTPISCWLIPLVLYMRMCWDYPEYSGKKGRPIMWHLEWVAIGLECALAEYKHLAQASHDDGLLRVGSHGFYKACLMALLCVVGAALAAGLTMGLVSIDPMEMEIIDQAAAERILPLIHDHHLLLVTLLLMNSIANEALPLFLDQIVPSWLAVVLSVSLVLMFGEIIPSAVFTGSEQLTMASRFAGLVSAFMFVLTPISWPIAKLLDRVLGADHKGRYNFAELRAIVSMHAGLRMGSDEEDQVVFKSHDDKELGIIFSLQPHSFTSESVVMFSETSEIPAKSTKLKVGQMYYASPCEPWSVDEASGKST
eukprot:g9144.t1